MWTISVGESLRAAAAATRYRFHHLSKIKISWVFHSTSGVKNHTGNSFVMFSGRDEWKVTWLPRAIQTPHVRPATATLLCLAARRQIAAWLVLVGVRHYWFKLLGFFKAGWDHARLPFVIWKIQFPEPGYSNTPGFFCFVFSLSPLCLFHNAMTWQVVLCPPQHASTSCRL